MKIPYIVAGVVVAVLLIVVISQWSNWFGAEPVVPEPGATEVQPSEDPGERLPEPAPVSTYEPVEPPQIELPSLENSDPFVREQVEAWPLPEAWTSTDNLLSRASVVVLNAADGKIPRRQLAFLAPREAFKVEEQDGRKFIAESSYKRYDAITDRLTAIPPEQVADFIETTGPLLNHALGQVGESRDVHALMDEAMARVAALPELDERIEVVQPNVMYGFADPQLEALPEFEKQLLRFGPDNVAKLKAHVAAVREALANR